MDWRDIALKPAGPEDAEAVAELESARTPDDPQDGEMIAFGWAHDPEAAHARRWIEDATPARVFVEATHPNWDPGDPRYGGVGASIHPAIWTEELFAGGIATAEAWLGSEAAAFAVAHAREDFGHELAALRGLGYGEQRRGRYWELDLVANRTQLLASAERSRVEMHRQGIELTTLHRIDGDGVRKALYRLDIDATRDVPTTAPFPVPTYDEWLSYYFDNPGIRSDRFWLARSGEEIAGMSLIIFPPGRGVPSTEFTATSPRFRSRGIARALKYETIVQAIEIGATRVRTDNDAQNAPILHLNEEMGYRPLKAVIELHRALTSEA